MWRSRSDAPPLSLLRALLPLLALVAASEVSARAADADGTALDVVGRITEVVVEVTAEMRDGSRIRAVWDRVGNGLSLEELD
jgi:hypothetical protein